MSPISIHFNTVNTIFCASDKLKHEIIFQHNEEERNIFYGSCVYFLYAAFSP